jgi:hypothetical protein
MFRWRILLATGLVGLFTLSLSGAAVAQRPLSTFYARADSVLGAHVDGGQVNYAALSERPSALRRLVGRIEQQDLSALPDPHAKAFLLNAYNLLVIDAVLEAYPVASPMDVPRFFGRPRYRVAGKQRSLDGVEKLLFDRFPDPRLHFALVCAAKSCPALPDSAYRGPRIDAQLERITRRTLRSPRFVEVNATTETVRLSRIFDWYTADFTRSAGSLIAYVNQYRREPIPSSYDVAFRPYDWSLNEPSTSTPSDASSPEAGDLQRFNAATLVRPGQFTVKLFNNLYTQTAFFQEGTRTEANQRSSFYTGILNTYAGLTPTLNAGVELYVQSVRYDDTGSSPFSTLSFESRPGSRTAVTSMLPKVKWAPRALGGTVLQIGVLIPFVPDPDLSTDHFLADGDPELQLNAFYDTPLSDDFLLYLEGELAGRFEGRSGPSASNEIRGSVRSIVNYYPTDRATLYGLVSTTPAYQFALDRTEASSQVGLGAKFELLPGVQVEGLVTTFPLGYNSGAGTTYNLGVRLLR